MSLKRFLTSKTFALQLALAVIIVIVVVYAALKWLDGTTNHGQEIPVPNLSKKLISEAEKELNATNLQYVILDTVDYNEDFPPYSIVQQDPLPEVNVKENRKVYVKINAGGYNDVRMPDLVQKTYRQAEHNLIALGLKIGKKTYKPYLAKDVVLEMSQNGKKLKSGDFVKKSSTIDLVLGDGKTGYQGYENDDIDTTTDTEEQEEN